MSERVSSTGFGGVGLVAVLSSLSGCQPLPSPNGTTSAAFQGAEASWTSDGVRAPRSVAWGDYDGDGDLDLAVADAEGPARVYRNDDGLFLPVWSGPSGGGTVAVAWADVDRDGDLDLAVGPDGQGVQVWTMDPESDSLLDAPASLFGEGATRSLAWGDVDGDGYLDLAVGSDPGGAQLFRSAVGVLGSTPSWTGGAGSWAVAWADVDSDGDLDLAAASEGADVVWNNVDGELSETLWSSDEALPTRSLSWGDWDGDGRPELAAGADGAGARVYANSGGELVAEAAWWDGTEDVVMAVAWGDWDGDGVLDLAVGTQGAAADRVHRNAGAGSAEGLESLPAWQTPEVAVSGAGSQDATWQLAWGDADGDGDLDLAAATGAGRPLRVWTNEALSLSRGWESESERTTWAAAWGDVDGDGDLDLAVGRTDGAQLYIMGPDGLATAVHWEAAEGTAYALAWGDWDGDGDLDLAVGIVGPAGESRGSRIYRNEGGALESEPAWTDPEGGDTKGIAWGDLDGDGDLDLVLSRDGPGQTRILETGPGGEFIATYMLPDPNPADGFAVSLGDMDRDGDLDIAVGHLNGPAAVFRNGGALADFTLAWQTSGSVGRRAVAWIDWDGDGDLDLATGSMGVVDSVEIYRSEGGQLAAEPEWSLDLGLEIKCLVVGDVDGDGDQDLAAAVWDGSDRIFVNEGGELSRSWLSKRPSFRSRWVALGDPDRDGDLDLLTAGGEEPAVLFENQARAPTLPSNATGIAVFPPPGIATAGRGLASGARSLGDQVTVPFILWDDESDPVGSVRLEYSLVGGGAWQPATFTLASDGQDSEGRLATSPGGEAHQLTWDLAADGVQSPHVALRLVAESQTAFRVGTAQRASAAGVTEVFPAARCFQPDRDGDTVSVCAGDCDDADPAAAPGLLEVCDDLVDNDCDGSEAGDRPDPDCWVPPSCAQSGHAEPLGVLGLAAFPWLLVRRRRD